MLGLGFSDRFLELKRVSIDTAEIINVDFDAHASFSFAEVKQGTTPSHRKSIVFSNVLFPKNRTLIKNIEYGGEPFVCFRNCDLGNAVFRENQMLAVSLFTSQFENASFISNEWGQSRYGLRKNLICEDLVLRDGKLGKSKKRDKSFEDVDANQVALLYAQFKRSADARHQNSLAGEFWYNEIETQATSGIPFPHKIWLGISRWLYGHGQKPGWCLFLLLIWVMAYWVASLYWGVQTIEGGVSIHSFSYAQDELALESLSFATFQKDSIVALSYVLTRTLPFQYFRHYEVHLRSAYWSSENELLINIVFMTVSLSLLAGAFTGFRRIYRRK